MDTRKSPPHSFPTSNRHLVWKQIDKFQFFLRQCESLSIFFRQSRISDSSLAILPQARSKDRMLSSRLIEFRIILLFMHISDIMPINTARLSFTNYISSWSQKEI
jgi:hypothetical protein